MRAYASCDHLVTTPRTKEAYRVRERQGKVVEVYDGRKWPVVRCGSVYVSPEDSARALTQTVVTATSVAEKKRRASKYTVAIGTSHGHVQAFLEDADSVLSALDQCQAEEKCLMLIKRPKEPARKMLKSHSWANLSVSEPQLYRQFNGVSLGQLHPATYQPYMMRRSSDQQSVTSSETDRSEGRRKYVTARGKENWRRQGQLSLPERSGFTSQLNDNYHLLSDASSAPSDCSFVERKGEKSRRGELYPSIPEDEQEINNNNSNSDNNNKNSAGSANNKAAGPGYRVDGLQDLVPNRIDPRRHGEQRQVQGHRGHVRSEPAQGPHRQAHEEVRDPSDLEDGGRSQSLSNLATGLTLSLVGQRKADSMLDLTFVSRHPPSRSFPSQSCKTEDGYPSTRRSPRESCSDSVRSPTDNYPEVFSPREAVNCFHYATVQSPPRANQERSYSCSTQPSHRSHRSYGNSCDNRAFSSSSEPAVPPRDVVVPPQKPKRSLPHVPPEETSEKIKRFTEIMRSRMSISSSANGRGSDNSVSSQTSVTPQTPDSRQASVTDNGSDAEVSTLLEGGAMERSLSPRQKRSVEATMRHQPAAATSVVRVKDAEGRGRLPPPHPHHTMTSASSGSSSGTSTITLTAVTTRRSSLLQDTPQHFGDHSSSGDSGQTPFTSHSHSSTMDSGYTTNTEGETEPHDHVTKLSPPHSEVRPTPAPRNPALAAARKFNSLQNVSSLHAHGNTLQPYFHHQNHDVSASSARGHAQTREAGPMKAQHVDVTGQVRDHRRGWTLAQNFKSLDYKPVAENSCPERPPRNPEERVLRPHAVVVNAGARSAEASSGSTRRNSFSKQNGVVSGNSGRDGGSRSVVRAELRGVERHSVSTLPGHWKYNSATTASGSNDSSSSHRARPAAVVAPPTLFQLSQNYALCAVKLALPVNTAVKNIVTLGTVQVVLPGMAADGSGGRNSQLSEGRQVQLGGPGSAFRPVRTGVQATVGMTGVGSLQDRCSQLCVVGDLRTGDVLVELNGWYCLNSDHASLQRVLENCQGEVTLTVARKKEEAAFLRDQQAEDSLQHLESEVMRLKDEVSKKDTRIQELSTIAWRKDSPCPDKVLLESEEGAFVIGDNEFVV